ncbi:MAG: beta-lactamase family protein [Lewinellaceae bacterium]|nr:beta-lactamase family protein [Phaeodactylibacter sp.]MCB9035017.1 beta-lactamase family protein [Lewinellaceae bacterium]
MDKKYPLVLFVIIALGFVLREQARPSWLGAAMLKDKVEQKRALLDPAFSQFIRDYESYLHQQLREEGVPGAAVAVVKDSAIALIRSYGLRSAASGEPVTLHTVFRIASLSKGFAGLLSAMVVKEGLLSWDEPVYKHVPGLRLKSEAQTHALQLRHVLSHTSGLPRHTYSNLLNMGMAYPAILEMLREVEPSHPAGVCHNYQNVAFSLSGDVLQSVAGKPYDQLLKERIFEPLGLTETTATYEEMLAAGNRAMPHRRTAGGFAETEVEPNYYEVLPAAGVNSSISDMAEWLQLLLGNRQHVASEELLGQIFRPFVDIPINDRVLRNWHGLEAAHYGMGWRILKLNGGLEVIQHSGYVNGYRAEIAFSRQEKLGIVLLANAPNYTVGHSIPAFFEQYQARCRLPAATANSKKEAQ